MERWEISGINRKLQMKPQKWNDADIKDDSATAAASAAGGGGGLDGGQ